MESREPEHIQLVAESARELLEVVDLIEAADLELVAVVAIAQPRADGELVLLFGGTAADKGAAA